MPIKLIIVTALILSSLITLFLSIYATAKIKKTSVATYVLLMICVSLYSIGYAFELSSSTIENILIGIKIEYTGMAFIPVFWVLFALQYSGIEIQRKRSFHALILIIPIITLLLVYTSESHEWYYKSINITNTKYFSVVVIEKGLWYMVYLIFSYVFIFLGSALFFRIIFHTSGFLKKQAIITFTASIIPWAGDILYITGHSFYNIDHTPFFLTMMGPLLLFALFRYKMFDLTPIARSIVFNDMRDPVFVLDNENRLVDQNSAAAKFLENSCRESIGLHADQLMSCCDNLFIQLVNNVEKIVEFQKTEQDITKYYNSHVTPMYSRSGAIIGNILSVQDITNEQNMIKKLHTLATIDELTRINNRRSFMDLCAVELHKSRRYERPLSLLLLDIDFFKSVNDKYGHQAGDEVLRTVAQSFQKNLRLCDISGRYGGEEFVIALPETGLNRVKTIAERLNKSISELRVFYKGNTISVTVSIGTFTVDKQYIDAGIDNALSKADEALYKAKEQGRDRVIVYSPSKT